MVELFSQQDPNDKLQCLFKNKLCLAIISAAIGAITAVLISKHSYTSNLLFLHTETTFSRNETRTSHPNKNISFNDEIAISYFQKAAHQHLSKFRCTGSENDVAAWDTRLCIFHNTCYSINTGRFHYFRSNQSKIKPLFYDSARGMLFQFGGNGGIDKFVSLSAGGGAPWAPITVNEPYPLHNVTRLRQLHSLMKSRFADHNIAHGLWEDLGSVSYSMDRMNVVDENLVIMHLNKIPDTSLFRNYHQYVLPALTKTPMVEFEVYVRSFNTTYVCFDSLIVGGQLSVFPKPQIRENHGREALFYNWRSKMIRYNGYDPKFVPQKHHIIITNKSNSLWTRPGSKLHRAIANLKDVEKFIRLTYPNISTEVVEWHTIPFNKQLEMLLNTTILITPCGGVSLIIPMLPHGAHAIVMDYYVTIAAHGFQPGQSGSMEGALLNHIAHVRKQYYQVYGPQDYQFDYPGASDAREASSIVVNMTRLQLLIDKALEEMEP